MRYPVPVCVALAALLALPAAGLAQRPPKLKIDPIHVGLPIGSSPLGEYKPGAWCPVFVPVTAGPDGLLTGGEVIIETTDCDDVRNNYRVRLPALEPNEAVTVMGYTKPSSISCDVTVTVKAEDQTFTRKDNFSGLQLGEVLFVTAGSPLTSLRQAMLPNKQGDEEAGVGRETGPRHFSYLDDVRKMPMHWFGYEAADLVVLTTANRDFMTALASERENRKEALAEWVRRGGRLVISTAKNQDVLASLDSSLGLLPVAVTGTVQVPRLNMGATLGDVGKRDLQNNPPRNNPGAEPPPLSLAKLEPKPGREFERLLPLEARAKEPLTIARGPYGLGQVTLVAFDFDVAPFTGWEGRQGFWERFMKTVGPTLPDANNPNPRQVVMNPGMGPEDDVASTLEKNLENFPDVPVISFGWVALFILLYIIVVGPLDYFFLKKVVKRLELTWITFPTVVIIISVASYFIAYYLKGNDQLINKVDLVDIDLQSRQAYGHCWFTIFSPRIQHYTIGLEPAAPDWAPAGGSAKQATSVLLSWMGRPEASYGGYGRAHSQSLFRRTYEYERDASALRGVPIQVWTTKSFAAEWAAPFDPARPLVRADLRHTPDKGDVPPSGTITSELPVELEDVVIFFRGKPYPLDRLLPHVPKRVDNALAGSPLDFKNWLNTAPVDTSVQLNLPKQSGQPRIVSSSYPVIKEVSFYGFTHAQNRRNTTLHYLDEGWRLNSGLKEYVIVMGRVPRKDGPAEETATSPASPTQLWLGDLPGPGQTRPAIPGSLSQETYVRIFIPLQDANEAPKPEP